MFALAATIAAITASAPIQAVAFDAPRLAYATGRGAGDCDRVAIWDRTTRRTIRLGRTTSCEQTSTGTGIAGLSIAGNRVLWLHFTGGNIREWSLFTATPTRRIPRRLAFVTADVDSHAPIVVGEGNASRFGDLLPFAVLSAVFVLRENGARRFAWDGPARVTALAARGGEVAVGMADGRIATLDASGKLLGTVRLARRPVDAVALTGNGIVAQQGRALRLLGPAARTRTLPAGARVRDAEGSRAVFLMRGRARLIDLDTGRTRDLGRATDVQLGGSTAAVAVGRAIRLVRVA